MGESTRGKKRNIKYYLPLITFLFVNFIVAFIGKIWTDVSVENWYLTLKKASWTPPSWIFGPVWIILYILMAIAGWLIFISPPSKTRIWALGLYFIQLFCNLMWTFLFFYLKNPFLALIDIVVLFWLLICLTYLSFKILKKAGFLLIPYLLWVSYAVTLNAAIWILNPS